MKVGKFKFNKNKLRRRYPLYVTLKLNLLFCQKQKRNRGQRSKREQINDKFQILENLIPKSNMVDFLVHSLESLFVELLIF